MEVGGIRISGFIAGIIVLVLGALMIAEAVASVVADSPFMFLDGVNRGFEFAVGFIAIVLAASTMDESRK
jgi:hypothetical protein